ncbi:DUF6000 family protein [Streptomyces sp. URMC 123]|uniref:DUF6000 family protein n=1 Tax=Streptomyces sp. URMC 123 TaxID=3423403 RepID=UPI003F1D8EF8
MWPESNFEALAATRRYVIPGRRYMKLHGWNLTHMDQAQRSNFMKNLYDSASIATAEELAILLKGEWRMKLTAAWMIAATRRTEFRRLFSRLLMNGGTETPKGYSVALARFGSHEDAQILEIYLRSSLTAGAPYAAQDWPLGGLMLLDSKLGSGYANSFLEPSGPWESWFGSTEMPNVAQLLPQIMHFMDETEAASQRAAFSDTSEQVIDFFDNWQPLATPENWHVLTPESTRSRLDQSLHAATPQSHDLHSSSPLSVGQCTLCGSVLFSLAPNRGGWAIVPRDPNTGAWRLNSYTALPNRESIRQYLESHPH